MGGEADPSTPLRSGRDDTSWAMRMKMQVLRRHTPSLRSE